MSALKKSIAQVGGAAKAAAICGVSQRAVYKWLSSGSLPRTEYTGETHYAQRLAGASMGQFTAEWLLAEASPSKGQPVPAIAADRRAQLAPDDHRGRRTTDPTGTEIRALRECAEQAKAVADRLAG